MKKISHTGDTQSNLIETPIHNKHTRIFLYLWGIWLSRDGLLCTLKQSHGLHFYPLNYTALLSYAVHFFKKLFFNVVSMQGDSGSIGNGPFLIVKM